ncbi:MAG: SLBB domain-containing protein [Acidobacteriota bacterium]
MSKRNAVLTVSLLLTLASLTQANLPTGHAQSVAGSSSQTPGDAYAYFIQGAVNKPGVYRIESAPSLLKLLALAGGLADSHGSTAFIIRRLKTPDSRGRYVKIDASLTGNLETATNLEPGDIVNIPQADVVFVTGEVTAAGSFPFKEGMTLVQAVSLARGVTVRAKTGRVVIFRQDPTTGRRLEINVDVDAVMSGKQKDVPLQPNDIIIVPNDRARTVFWRFLDTPPIPVLVPCRGSRRCMARLDLSLFEAGNEQD